jgi:hypothetical protein
MKSLKVIQNVKNMNNQKFQYHSESEQSMSSKNDELICDEQYQSKDFAEQQR